MEELTRAGSCKNARRRFERVRDNSCVVIYLISKKIRGAVKYDNIIHGFFVSSVKNIC